MPLFMLCAPVFPTVQNRTYYRELAMFPPNCSDYALPVRWLGKECLKADFPGHLRVLSVIEWRLVARNSCGPYVWLLRWRYV